jgi:hypothetical protein
MGSKTVSKTRTKDLKMTEDTRNMLAYRFTPDRIATFILEHQTIDTHTLKSTHIETLLNKYPMGYTFKKLNGMDIRLNRNDSNVARLEKEERNAGTQLMTWFKMKHGRHTVDSADEGIDSTMGQWTIEIWEAGTIPEIPRKR